ncbi:peptidylprolyl isomerase [Piscinibacter sakaiensis]|uniref:peptidylprolyl isomerase n=1 Tax=Piscinibacter sakaiensis TaxID=1547922 RepID=UPI003AB0B6EA
MAGTSAGWKLDHPLVIARSSSAALRRLFGRIVLAGSLLAAPAAFAQTVMLATSMGDIVIQLDASKAPKSVDNFLQYVKAGHYNGTVFHRVIGNFMIQGGGFTPDLVQKPTRAPIPLESRNGLNNDRGTVAMARTSVPDSATSQFFINLKDNDFLNSANSRDGNGYAVFGKVISGMDVVDRIAAVPTQSRGMQQNVPVQPVTILEAVVQQ